MKYLPDEDTIVALSSPLGKGAIAVIRVSGKQSLPILNPLLKRRITRKDARIAVYNEINSIVSNQKIDQVMTTFFSDPGSYTGEDVVEISCHCNPFIIDKIIAEVIHGGARIAKPGEFTFRAFMNGKLDLSQAEAVAEIIDARSRQSLLQSIRHLDGRLSERINQVKSDILDYLSLLEINLDFSDEDIEALPYDELRRQIGDTIERIDALLRSYDYGRLLQEGIKLLILGKPNVGKSSLLNLLLERERAIVSEIPGTTRDFIEASLEIEGLAVQAVDTAGIRKTEDAVEAKGVERALEQIQTSDIALCIFEAHRKLNHDDRVLIEIVKDNVDKINFVIILNKIDLGHDEKTAEALADLKLPLIKISAMKNSGIDALKKAIKEQLVSENSMESEEIVVTSARHKQALEATIDSLTNALQAVESQSTEEIIAVDIRLALDHLGEITGETTSEDVLNHIFTNFCIGK